MERTIEGAVALAIGFGVACSHDAAGPNPRGIADIVMTPDTITVAVGDTATISAQPVTSSGAPVPDLTIFWSSSDSTIATVDQQGMVTARGVGTINVDASTAGVSPRHPARVVVESTPVASIVIAPQSVSMHTGGAFQFTDTTKDAAGHIVTGRPVQWSSSDTGVAAVDQAGLVRAKQQGSAMITVATGRASATASVSVGLVPVKKVVVAPSNPTVAVGSTTQLSAITEDSAGNALTGRTVSWATADPTIATVDQTGTVTGKAAGSATISATSEGVTGTAVVQVSSTSVTTVAVNPPSATIFATAPGNTQILTASTTPAGTPVTWSNGNSAVATVDQHGQVTATGTAAGAAIIAATATNGTGSGSATISVIGHVRTVSLNVSNTLNNHDGGNNTATGTATLIDTFGADVSAQRGVKWTSSDPSTITINGGASAVANPATVPVTLTMVSNNSPSVIITVTTDDGATGSITIQIQN